MITTAGRSYLARSLALGNTSVGDYISMGVGNSAPNANSTELDFELYRVPIEVRTLDSTTNTIYLRSRIPSEVGSKISEVGVVGSSTGFDNALFAPGNFQESAVGGSWSTAPGIFGTPSLLLVPTSSTASSTITSPISVMDKFKFIFAVSGTISSVQFRFGSDSSNYYSVTFSNPTGVNVFSRRLSEFTITGTPNWDQINMVDMRATGSGEVVIDGIGSFSDEESTLVFRQTLPTVTILPGETRDMQLQIKLNITG